jgi:metal-responsive CopG/Arc/MetJ family transcriptional regulator
MLETISLKMEKAILQEIDRKLPSYRYSTRTEFIRDAIRSKMSELEKRELLKAVDKIYGASKRKTTDRQLHEAKERAFEDLEKRFK